MQDQVNMLSSLGLKAAFISCDQQPEITQEIKAGKFMFVFVSPESTLESFCYIFDSDIHSNNLIGIAVDEVHCVTQWGISNNNKKRSTFRSWYSRLNEIRSMVNDLPFMALTATATEQTKQRIFELLEFETPSEIWECPNKANIRYSVQKLDNSSFYESQLRALYNFICGEDVFVNLPTGYGKSLIYQMAPLIHSWMHKNVSRTRWKKYPILLIISPLTTLMQDQVNMLSSLGLKAAFISCDQQPEITQEIEAGKFMFVFVSPESTLESFCYIFDSDIYSNNLIGIAVDEVHCVTQWGISNNNKKRSTFRSWYSRLNEIRSMVNDLPFMALTATATEQTKQRIFELLEFETPSEIWECPNKANIRYSVQKLDNSVPIIKTLSLCAEYIFTIADVTKLVDIWQMKHATTILDIFRTIFGDVDEQIMDIDYEDDYSEQVCNYEWVDIVNDQSFMELLNQSEWFVDSVLEDDPDDNI